MLAINRLISNPYSIILSLNHHGLLSFLSDKAQAKLVYRASFGKKLNLEHPSTFNEKIQWLKLYDRNPRYTIMVDKHKVKEYVAGIIGKEYIIPTFGVWNSFDEIDFDSLPDQFVLKTAHDGGGGDGIVICRDKNKFDIAEAKAKLERSQKRNVYTDLREWPYKNVPHYILAEQFMTDGGKDLQDYKIHCFGGEPKLILVCKDRFGTTGLTEDFYTDTWDHVPVRRPKHPNAATNEAKPELLGQMLELAKKLSNGIPFVRTDFYIINNRIYFGELTFYPTSGFTAFVPESYDTLYGEWIRLPNKH